MSPGSDIVQQLKIKVDSLGLVQQINDAIDSLAIVCYAADVAMESSDTLKNTFKIQLKAD